MARPIKSQQELLKENEQKAELSRVKQRCKSLEKRYWKLRAQLEDIYTKAQADERYIRGVKDAMGWVLGYYDRPFDEARDIKA